MPPQQGQAAVTINTGLIRNIVIAIIICGALGILIYLSDVFIPTLETVEPPILHTMTTEKVRLMTKKHTANTPRMTIFLSTTTTTTTEKETSTLFTTSTTENEISTTTLQDNIEQILTLSLNIKIDGYEQKISTHSKVECR